MIRHKSSGQFTISEFKMPFETNLDENYRWVILSKVVPRGEFARLYYMNFKSNRGSPVKNARAMPEGDHHLTHQEERREAAKRNRVEGKFGQGKRGFGLQACPVFKHFRIPTILQNLEYQKILLRLTI